MVSFAYLTFWGYYRAVANGDAHAAGNPASKPSFKLWFCGQVFDLLRSQGRYLIVSLAVVLCVYFLSGALRSFAGQITVASLTLRLLVNVFVKWAVTMTVSGLSLALFIREKNQHERTRERLTKRITELEAHYDPARTSSLLTTKGRTRKGDE